MKAILHTTRPALALLAGAALTPSLLAAGDGCSIAPQCATLSPTHAAASDFFGQAVDMWDDTAVVGASRSAIPGADDGVAYVYVRDASGWVEQARLTPDIITDGANFADAVAIHEDTVVVGAYTDDSLGNAAGAAFVYVRDANDLWNQQARLLAPDGDSFDNFGRSVEVSGDYVVVGADGAEGGGAAYVYQRSGGTWNHYQTLQAGDATASFGYDVAISFNSIAVGAWQDNDNGTASGAVYTFYANEIGGVDVWQETQKLTAADAGTGQSNAYFGAAVDMSGSRLIVGSYGWDSLFAPNTGTAYTYRAVLQLFPNPPEWTFCEQLFACDLAEGDNFGYDVAVSGTRAVVGAPFNDDFGSSSGAAYTFDSTGGFIGCPDWFAENKLLPDVFSVGAGDRFGRRVAVSDGLVLAGSHFNDENGVSAGLVYAQNVEGTCLPDATCGAMVYGQDITPTNDLRLFSAGSTQLGETAVFAISNIPAGIPVAFNGLYFSDGLSTLGTGTVLVQPASFLPSVLSTPAPVVLGQAAWTVQIPDSPALAGIPFYQQGLVFDAAKPDGFALTNGLRFSVCDS